MTTTAIRGPDPGAPESTIGRGTVTVATYDTYPAAVRAVDRLATAGFHVDGVDIVGRGVSTVESVTGRVTWARATLQGAGIGLWFGLLIGLLLGLFAPGVVWLSTILVGLVLGAFWGGVVGLILYWAAGDARDFRSVHSMTADHYEVRVDPGLAGEARALLETIPPYVSHTH